MSQQTYRLYPNFCQSHSSPLRATFSPVPEVSSPRQQLHAITSKLDEIDNRCRDMHFRATQSLLEYQHASNQNFKESDEVAKLRANISHYKEQQSAN